MIRTPPQHNTTNPPGQAVNTDWKPPRYLRDVIKRIHEQEVQEIPEHLGATTPSTSPEKRLEAVLKALEGLARQAETRQAAYDGWWAQELRLLVKENS